MSTVAETSAIIGLKGGRFSLSCLQIKTDDLVRIQDGVRRKIDQAPDLFKNAPIILDIDTHIADRLNLALLVQKLRELEIIPIALRSDDQAVCQRAVDIGLALLSASPSNPPLPNVTAEQSALVSTASKPTSSAMMIHRPVRSGQQIYADQKDLIIFGSVSEGAEIIADGHIHVYGTLRGKALAGASGNEEARIFCVSMNPQLLSIAGCYRLFENPDEFHDQKPMQAYLKNDHLIVETL